MSGTARLWPGPQLRPACPLCQLRAGGPSIGPAPGRRRALALLGALAAGSLAPPGARAREGVDVGPPSIATKLVSAEQIEQAAAQQYAQTVQNAARKNLRAKADHPQLIRLRAISSRIIPHTYEWNARARNWNWQVNLIGSPQINAFCMPGGKIAFFYGILDKLQLNDDEVAMIMGHETAHALREHAREQMGKRFATRGAIELGSAIFGLRTGGRILADMGGQLLSLQFSRSDETEADLVGLELAARAGYDPRAGVSLWQKMAAASQRSSVELLSTHPSGPTRISDIQRNLPKVDGLYLRAEKPSQRFAPPTPANAPPSLRGR